MQLALFFVQGLVTRTTRVAGGVTQRNKIHSAADDCEYFHDGCSGMGICDSSESLWKVSVVSWGIAFFE